MLNISPTLKLPTDFVTQTAAILARRGAGKSYTASVLAEEMIKDRLQVCVIDPVGVFFGLRSSADGKSDGLPIVIFGGDHGDLPLESTAGQLIADVVMDKKCSAVLDLSLLRKGEQDRFVCDFAERLYFKNRSPLHLLVDEADAFIPQRPMPGQQRMLGAMEDLVRRGRARGIGMTMVTQRSAVINKNVLSQAEVLICLQTIAPQDRSAVEHWIEAHGTEEQRHIMMESLASLPVGTAWVWSPSWAKCFQKVKIRTRETFDSSSTPKIGTRRIEPKKLADVEIESLKTQMAAVIERAKADDPRELKKKIAELERVAKSQPQVIDPNQLKAAEERGRKRAVQDYESRITELQSTLGQIGVLSCNASKPRSINESNLPSHPKTMNESHSNSRPAKSNESYFNRKPPCVNESPHHRNPPALNEPITTRKPTLFTEPLYDTVKGRMPDQPADGSAVVPLNRCERAIVKVLYHYPQGKTKKQIGVIAGYSHGSGGFNNALGKLRSTGLIEGYDTVVLTKTAREGCNGSIEPLPTGRQLLEHWLRQLGRCERTILETVRDSSRPLTKQEIAEKTQCSFGSGGFNNALGKLRTLELISGYDQIEANKELYDH